MNSSETKTHRVFTRLSAVGELQNVNIEGVSVQVFSSKRPNLARFTPIAPFSKEKKNVIKT